MWRSLLSLEPLESSVTHQSANRDISHSHYLPDWQGPEWTQGPGRTISCQSRGISAQSFRPHPSLACSPVAQGCLKIWCCQVVLGWKIRQQTLLQNGCTDARMCKSRGGRHGLSYIRMKNGGLVVRKKKKKSRSRHSFREKKGWPTYHSTKYWSALSRFDGSNWIICRINAWK